MITVLKSIVRDDRGSTMVSFGLLAMVVGYAFLVNAWSFRCGCFRPDATGLFSVQSVERLFGTVLATL